MQTFAFMSLLLKLSFSNSETFKFENDFVSFSVLGSSFVSEVSDELGESEEVDEGADKSSMEILTDLASFAKVLLEIALAIKEHDSFNRSNK